MSEAFQGLMDTVAKAIENRTISFATFRGKAKEKAELYNKGQYNPFFSLILIDGQIKCCWSSDLTKKQRELEIICLGGAKCREGFTPEEWDTITLKVMHAMKLKL